MRAVTSILSACGRLKLTMLDSPEDVIVYRSLKDVNLPKFTIEDVPLYLGIMGDLFPGLVITPPDYTMLLDKLKEACVVYNLIPKESFLDKCIQLFETIMVRHGLMVTGITHSGKTMTIKCLQYAMTKLDGCGDDFAKTQ